MVGGVGRHYNTFPEYQSIYFFFIFCYEIKDTYSFQTFLEIAKKLNYLLVKL